MRPRNQQLTEKYKAIRLRTDSFYGSRTIQIFLNKFITEGKKAVSRRQVIGALVRYRCHFRRPTMFYSLVRVLHRLRIQFILVQRRKARELLSVPVPVRRNKRDVLNLQTLYKAISGRHERTLSERIQLELFALTFKYQQAPTFRARNAHLVQVFNDRTNMGMR